MNTISSPSPAPVVLRAKPRSARAIHSGAFSFADASFCTNSTFVEDDLDGHIDLALPPRRASAGSSVLDSLHPSSAAEARQIFPIEYHDDMGHVHIDGFNPLARIAGLRTATSTATLSAGQQSRLDSDDLDPATKLSIAVTRIWEHQNDGEAPEAPCPLEAI
jgi:hypothetical protein